MVREWQERLASPSSVCARRPIPCRQLPSNGLWAVTTGRLAVDAFRRGLEPFFCGPPPGGGREGLLKFSACLGALSVAKQKRSEELMRWLIDRRWTKGDRKRRFQGDGPAQQLFGRCHVIFLLSHQAFGLGQKYLGSEAVGRIGVPPLF